jgi:predicted dehydrogenase
LDRASEDGDLYYVTGCYAQGWLFHPTDFNWRVDAVGVGELWAVVDIGTHWLDLVQHVTDRHVEAVCAFLQAMIPERLRPRGGDETSSGKTKPPARRLSWWRQRGRS